MTLDLHRPVPDPILAEIAKIGPTFEHGVTVGDIIAGCAGIGYGGHLDECSEDEQAIHSIIAQSPAEYEEIDAARNEYTSLLRAAMDAVAWPPPRDTIIDDPVQVYGSDDEDLRPLRWTICGDLRTFEHCDGNHVWSDEVKRRFGEEFASGAVPVTAKVEFDTESGCFFAYTDTESVAELIANIARNVHQTFFPEPGSRWS